MKSAKLLLRKSLEEKSSHAECHFNKSPQEDGYSPSEVFYGKQVLCRLPNLDNSINIEEGKVAQEKIFYTLPGDAALSIFKAKMVLF